MPPHKTVSTARKTPGLEEVAPSTTLYDGRGGGRVAWGVTTEHSPRENGLHWNQGGNIEAVAAGKAGGATAMTTAAIGIDGRRELSLKQLHVRGLDIPWQHYQALEALPTGRDSRIVCPALLWNKW